MRESVHFVPLLFQPVRIRFALIPDGVLLPQESDDKYEPPAGRAIRI